MPRMGRIILAMLTGWAAMIGIAAAFFLAAYCMGAVEVRLMPVGWASPVTDFPEHAGECLIFGMYTILIATLSVVMTRIGLDLLGKGHG